MYAIDDIKNYFYSDMYKRNIKVFLERLLPEDGEIIDHGKVKGSVGSSSDGGYWKENPQVWWDVVCNYSGVTYRLHFITKDHFMGDVTWLCVGNKNYNILEHFNEDKLNEAINNFFDEAMEEYLVVGQL